MDDVVGGGGATITTCSCCCCNGVDGVDGDAMVGVVDCVAAVAVAPVE